MAKLSVTMQKGVGMMNIVNTISRWIRGVTKRTSVQSLPDNRGNNQQLRGQNKMAIDIAMHESNTLLWELYKSVPTSGATRD